MGIEYSIAELLDRFSILELKASRLSNRLDYREELFRFEQAILEDPKAFEMSTKYLQSLKRVNEAIWDLEADIRQDNELSLEETGRRARLIRKHNAERWRIKNLIAASCDDLPEVKIDHASVV